MFTSIINAIVGAITSTFTNAALHIRSIKFYFVAVLIFLLALGVVYKDSITMGVQSALFSQVKFRECRDLLGLERQFETILKADTNIDRYGVYLYQPINHSVYKKLILTNSEIAMRNPNLQGIYLKDQPTLNNELLLHDYYIVDNEELRKHADAQSMFDVSSQTRLFYALKVNGVIMGEIVVRFKHTPTPLDIDKALREISPLLFNYII